MLNEKMTIDGIEFICVNGYSDYAVSRCGLLYYKRFDKVIKPGFILKNGAYELRSKHEGYIRPLFYNDAKIPRRISFHRLLAQVFLNGNAEIPEELVVNHIDGVKYHNYVDNLEIVTQGDNIRHAFAIGLNKARTTRPEHKPVSILHVKSNKFYKFKSIADAARFIGFSKDVASSKFQKGPNLICENGYRYKYGHEPFDDLTCKRLEEVTDYGNNSPVVLRSVITGKVKKYDSSKQCCDEAGFSQAYLSTKLGESNQPILFGWVQAQKLAKLVDWIDHPDIILAYQDNTLDKFVVVVHTDGVMKLYSSAKKAAEALGIIPTTMNYRLSKKGKGKTTDGSKSLYYSDWVSLYGNIDGITSLIDGDVLKL